MVGGTGSAFIAYWSIGKGMLRNLCFASVTQWSTNDARDKQTIIRLMLMLPLLVPDGCVKMMAIYTASHSKKSHHLLLVSDKTNKAGIRHKNGIRMEQKEKFPLG